MVDVLVQRAEEHIGARLHQLELEDRALASLHQREGVEVAPLVALLQVERVPASVPASLNAETAATEVTVRAGEADEVYYYAPNVIEVRPGLVRVTFVNEARRE